MAKQKTLTYESLIKLLSTKHLTGGNLPGILTKLSNVIDDLGIQRMEALESDQFDQSAEQQRKLITIRDHLYRTFLEYNSRDRKHIRSDLAAQAGISNCRPSAAEDIGSWII